MRETKEYREAKRKRVFHDEMRRVEKQRGSHEVQSGMTAKEMEVRLGFLQKCPKELPEGHGAIVSVQLR
jgi:hypothetical protein